jgi:hypothetical protein
VSDVARPGRWAKASAYATKPSAAAVTVSRRAVGMAAGA